MTMVSLLDHKPPHPKVMSFPGMIGCRRPCVLRNRVYQVQYKSSFFCSFQLLSCRVCLLHMKQRLEKIMCTRPRPGNRKWTRTTMYVFFRYRWCKYFLVRMARGKICGRWLGRSDMGGREFGEWRGVHGRESANSERGEYRSNDRVRFVLVCIECDR